MKHCTYMNTLVEENNKNVEKSSSWQPNKDIKCNDCVWCQEWRKTKKYVNSTLSIETKNKIDIQLIKVYTESSKGLLRLLSKAIDEEDKNQTIFYYETLIKWVRNLYRNYLLENGVTEANDFNFIYTKKFMMLAKDVV